MKLAFLLIYLISCKALVYEGTTENRKSPQALGRISTLPVDEKFTQKITEAKDFVQKKQFNDKICFLLDMSIHSGKNRFFIYSFDKKTVIEKSLVAHGNCFQWWLEGRQYSNKVGSGCTSLGKYRVGKSYTGKFGYSYKLHGLESSNSNAYERTVVLHAYGEVPDTETEDEICQSNGCPMVSHTFFKKIKKVVNDSKKPVLLWIYE